MRYAGMVVIYNPDDAVIENVKSYAHDLEKLYIVDNSSTSNEAMFEKFTNAQYLPNYKNLGIAAALNIGFYKAIEEGFDYLLTMDQDSQFYEHGVLKLIDYIEHENQQNAAIFSPFHETALSAGEHPHGISSPTIVMTSGNFVNIKAYQKVGGFNEWMFIDCVDFDFCLNLRRHGYEIIQVNDIALKHGLGDFFEKKLFGKIYLCDNHNAFRRYYIVRNSFYVCSKYMNDFPDYCRAVLGDVRHGFFTVLLFEKHKFSKLWNMTKGYLDYRLKIKEKK